MLAQQFAGHRRAFYMPAGTSLSPCRIPFDLLRLAALGGLPQYEIERIAFALIDLDALAGAQVVDRFAGQLAVTGEIAHRVIDVAVAVLIRQALADQLPDQIQHLRYVLRGAR